MISYVKRNITDISKKGDFIVSVFSREKVDIYLGDILVHSGEGNIVFDEPIPTFVNMRFSRPVQGVLLLYDRPVTFPTYFMLFSRKWKYEKDGAVSEVIQAKL